MTSSWSLLQLYTAYLYLYTALRVSGGISTDHQELMSLYLQHLALVKPWLQPVVDVTGWELTSSRPVTLYGWLSGMQEHMLLHTRQSSIQNNKCQVSHKYSCFSWWWAHSCLKRVEKRNKHTKKNCAPSWLYLQDQVWTYIVLARKKKRNYFYAGT